MTKVKEQMYFESIDEVFCRPLDYFLHDAKIEGLKEIKLVKAIKDTDNKSYVWCTHEGEVTERQMCKKAECPYYSSKSGRGVCEHRGQLYLHDEEVAIDVALGKEKEEKVKETQG